MKKTHILRYAIVIVYSMFSLALKAHGGTDWLMITYTNPTPEIDDHFGNALAGVGDDRVLIGTIQDDIGASNAGGAYLFDLDGTLLTTYTNPAPEIGDQFGFSVSSVGTDKVLIGARSDNTGAFQAGAVYLFDLDGTLLTTYTNPTPAGQDWFGSALSGVGTDKVLIGANSDNTGASGAGAAYLYDLSGTLLTTYTNPAPAIGDFFGESVSGVGTDKVLIGAGYDDTGTNNTGTAYLYDLSGTLLTTYTNPTPEIDDRFGSAVSSVGTDKVLIGAHRDNTGASGAGAAYLYDLDGTLLTTYTNPTPAIGESFGFSVSSMGSDRVLIGANKDDLVANNTGAAYLYDLAGALLNTFTNPTPEISDWFGYSISGVGTHKALIGAYFDNTGASGTGAAYLFVFPDTHYVDTNNLTPTYPYTSWGTAANVIQDAVAAATDGDTVLVSNGVYSSGTTVTPGYSSLNRVVITNDIIVRSVNGPEVTVIMGGDSVRGVYMSAGTLSGFTITNGHAVAVVGPLYYERSGGGVNMYGGTGVVTNCVLTGNSAINYGGGSFDGTLTDCTLIGNTASSLGGGSCFGTLNGCTIISNSAQNGGGSANATLNNCTLTGNSAGFGGGSANGTLHSCTLSGNSAVSGGGGSYQDTLTNCIVYFNTASSGSNWSGSVLSYCSTSPDPGGTGNVTNNPLLAPIGDYGGPTQTMPPLLGSPAIDAGTDTGNLPVRDQRGYPRVINDGVDIGACESFYVTNSYSSGSGFALEWMPLPAGWNSVVKYSTNLVTMPFTDLSAPMPYPMNSYTDLVHGSEDQGFYKVEIQP